MRCIFVPLAASLLALIAARMTVAQQYVGSSFSNSMPPVTGSEITFWNILDARGASTSLLNYQSLGTNGSRLSPLNVRKAIISLHGLTQDPDSIMTGMVAALRKAHLSQDAVSQDTIAMVAPLFANTDQASEYHLAISRPPVAMAMAIDPEYYLHPFPQIKRFHLRRALLLRQLARPHRLWSGPA